MNRKYRKTVIAGNWKMNKTPTETKAFMTEFKAIMPKGRQRLRRLSRGERRQHAARRRLQVRHPRPL